MARSLSLALAATRYSGKNVSFTRALNFAQFTRTRNSSPSGLFFFRSDTVSIDGCRNLISPQLCPGRFRCRFISVCSYNDPKWLKSSTRSSRSASQPLNLVQNLFGHGMFSAVPTVNSNRLFTTSSVDAGRSDKGSFDSPGLGTSKFSKRKRSSVGQLPNLNNATSFDFIYDKRTRLKLKETRLKISKGVRRIRSNILFQNKKLRDNLKEQKLKKNGLVRSLKKQLVTKTKRENIKTIPNLLTTLRMASAPLLSYLVISDYYGSAFSIFVLAGLTDLLDGYIARNFKNQRTAFGTALDPLADKLLISFLTVSLTMNGLIPLPLTVLILGRDAGLVIASFYIRYISLAPPRTLARYFDFSHVTAKIYPSNISKINTAFQLSFVAFTLAAPVFDFVESPWLQLLMYTTAATTFLSGADYLLTWRRRLKIVKNT